MTTLEFIDKNFKVLLTVLLLALSITFSWVKGDHLVFVAERALFMAIDRISVSCPK